MSKEISKISFVQGGEGGVHIAYASYDDKGLVGTTGKDYKRVPSAPFKDAMQNIKTHYLFILEFMDQKKFTKYAPVKEDDVVGKNFRICGFTMSGEGAKAGIIISGFRTVSNGLGSSLNTFNQKVQGEGDYAYKFMNELLADIATLKVHAGEYMAGKHTVRQGKLDLNDGEENDGQPGSPAASK
jgi:hypothetical protein